MPNLIIIKDVVPPADVPVSPPTFSSPPFWTLLALNIFSTLVLGTIIYTQGQMIRTQTKIIKEAGENIGIGTTGPEAKIDLSDPSFRGRLKLLTTSGVGHDFGYNGGIDNLFWFSHFGDENGETKFLWEKGGFSRDLLVIKNTGNIGIGTSEPQVRLQISSEGEPALRFQKTSGATAVWDSRIESDGSYRIQDRTEVAATNPLTIERGSPGWTLYLGSTGNVGIGTRNSQEKLEIAGGLKLKPSTPKPECDSFRVGVLWFTPGEIGAKDTLELCAKSANDKYLWRKLY